MELMVIETTTSSMRTKRSTTELQPRGCCLAPQDNIGHYSATPAQMQITWRRIIRRRAASCPNLALSRPTMVGISEITRIATITNSKFSCTTGIRRRNAEQREQRGPAQAAQHRERRESRPSHAGDAGDERHERADEREETPEEHGQRPPLLDHRLGFGQALGVRALTLPDSMMRRPKKCPMK